MTDLNSIIIEGVLTKDPDPKQFEILSVRDFPKSKGMEREEIYITVEVEGRLSEVCYSHLVKDRGVRIVGRLNKDLCIRAEHVEFKPMTTPANN